MPLPIDQQSTSAKDSPHPHPQPTPPPPQKPKLHIHIEKSPLIRTSRADDCKLRTRREGNRPSPEPRITKGNNSLERNWTVCFLLSCELAGWSHPGHWGFCFPWSWGQKDNTKVLVWSIDWKTLGSYDTATAQPSESFKHRGKTWWKAMEMHSLSQYCGHLQWFCLK